MLAVASYWKIYKKDDIDSDSVQCVIVMIPFIKAAQMCMVLLSFSLCYSDNLAAITMQKYILMLLLATETVCRTAIAALFYIIATVRFFLSITHYNEILGLGHTKVLLRC